MRRDGWFRVGLIVGAIAGSLMLAPRSAQAQFVCDSVTPGGADGASVAGIGVACGTNATAANGATAFGANADASGGASTALGQASQAVGNSAVSVGISAGSNSNSARSTSVGPNAGQYVGGQQNVAIGYESGSGVAGSPLNVSNTVAIGTQAVARADGAVAIGNGAQATRVNQVALGTTANTYTMAGIASAASLAAQTGPVQLVTSDASGNLATMNAADLGLASAADLSAINSRLDDLNGRTNKAITGVAMAFAMAGVPTLLPSERFAVSGNWGTFQGANGFALNAAVRLGDNVQFNGGIGYGADERIVGGRAGLRFGW